MDLRQEHCWDNHYALELKNFEEDGDEGDIWFGKRLSREIIRWLIEKIVEQSKQSSGQDKAIASIIDVGCGNAFLLCEFAKQFRDKFGSLDDLRLFGLDYSSNSIKLSEKILESRNLNQTIHLKQCDFLNFDQLQSATGCEKYDFILDKGTYDAICLLSGNSDHNLLQSKQQYLKSLCSLVRSGSIFIIASCNNTKDELVELMSNCSEFGQESRLIHNIETPSIQFGGKTGSQVTCLIFRF